MTYVRLLGIILASLVINSLNWPLSAQDAAAQDKQRQAIRTPHPKNPAHQKFGVGKNSELRKEQQKMKACKFMDPNSLPAPRIGISMLKQSGAMRGGKYKVKGVIEGTCIKEAGVYESGERIFRFPLETTPYYRRFKFELEVKFDNNPEIRAFNTNWKRSSKMLMSGIKSKK